LQNVFTSLKPGGRIFMEMQGKELLARNYRSSIVDDYPGGITLVQRNKLFDSWTRNRCEWLVIKGDRVRRYAFDLRIYSGGELAGLLKAAGFTEVKLYGSFKGEEYGLSAQRLFATAVKPSR